MEPAQMLFKNAWRFCQTTRIILGVNPINCGLNDFFELKTLIMRITKHKVSGILDYVNFLRATQIYTNDVREKVFAFERAAFNIALNNRDDHLKNFAYLMSPTGDWKRGNAPTY